MFVLSSIFQCEVFYSVRKTVITQNGLRFFGNWLEHGYFILKKILCSTMINSIQISIFNADVNRFKQKSDHVQNHLLKNISCCKLGQNFDNGNNKYKQKVLFENNDNHKCLV